MTITPDGALIVVDNDPYFRRRPVNVRDENGVFACDTEPWKNVDEFDQCCDLLDAFQRETSRQGFWTTEAWFEMLAWGETPKEVSRNRSQSPRQQ